MSYFIKWTKNFIDDHVVIFSTRITGIRSSLVRVAERTQVRQRSSVLFDEWVAFHVLTLCFLLFVTARLKFIIYRRPLCWSREIMSCLRKPVVKPLATFSLFKYFNMPYIAWCCLIWGPIFFLRLDSIFIRFNQFSSCADWYGDDKSFSPVFIRKITQTCADVVENTSGRNC